MHLRSVLDRLRADRRELIIIKIIDLLPAYFLLLFFLIFKGVAMNFEIEKSAFLSSIQKVQSVVERRQSMSLLSNVRIIAGSQQIEVIATDLEVGIRDLALANVIDQGSITVSAKFLYDVLKELPEDKVVFQVEENNWIRIACGASICKLVGTSDEDYPRLPEIIQEKLIKISGELLDNLAKKTVYAVSHDENRRVLNGVLFKITTTVIRMVATDGHRMAMIETPNTSNFAELEVILPQKSIHEVQRMINSGSEQLEFGLMDNHIVFKTGNEVVITRMIEGQFPNYSIVIPKETQYEIKLNKESLGNSLRRVALFSDLKARGVRFQLSDNSMQINANTPEYGEAKDELAIEYAGEPLSIGFNVNYVLDILKCIDSESVVMRISNTSGPVIFQPESQTEFTYITVVMPMII
jgi:DNA polymerase III subunit beta